MSDWEHAVLNAPVSKCDLCSPSGYLTLFTYDGKNLVPIKEIREKGDIPYASGALPCNCNLGRTNQEHRCKRKAHGTYKLFQEIYGYYKAQEHAKHQAKALNEYSTEMAAKVDSEEAKQLASAVIAAREKQEEKKRDPFIPEEWRTSSKK